MLTLVLRTLLGVSRCSLWLITAVALLTSLVSVAGQSFPANVEFDMIFPRENEIYTPEVFFPLVFAIRNASAAWPTELHIDVALTRVDANGTRDSVGFSLPNTTSATTYTGGPAPADPYIFIAGTALTSSAAVATTSTEYRVQWGPRFEQNCTRKTNSTAPYENFAPSFSVLTFYTAPNAPNPDIAAAVQACPTLFFTATIDDIVTDPTDTSRQCPVLASDAPPAQPCTLQPLADAIATNVSSAMLDLMGRTDGTWQSSTACQSDTSHMMGSCWTLLALISFAAAATMV